jgi:hypothetical protein
MPGEYRSRRRWPDPENRIERVTDLCQPSFETVQFLDPYPGHGSDQGERRFEAPVERGGRCGTGLKADEQDPVMENRITFFTENDRSGLRRHWDHEG